MVLFCDVQLKILFLRKQYESCRPQLHMLDLAIVYVKEEGT